MRLAVAGTGSAVGEVVVPWLRRSGHEVVDLDPQPWAAPQVDRLADAMVGCDAVLHLTGAPARLVSRLRWRAGGPRKGDRARRLVRAAEVAGVRRVVVTSSSLLYADQGGGWITEGSPVCVTTATEPSAEREHAVQRFADAPCRTGVVLRLGLLLGDSALTRWSLHAARRGRPVGLGDPDGFMHVVHSDDVGPAVEAALSAPTGTYNVGAAPMRRSDIIGVLADAAGQPHCQLLGPLRGRWAGERAEPLGRSLRVSSAAFRERTGWSPRHAEVDLGWFAAGVVRSRVGAP